MRAELLILAAVAGLAAAPTLNLLVDPFETFRPRDVSFSPYSADRVAKLEHVFAAPRYDGMLLGSSRTSLLDPNWSLDTDGRWYNLGLLGAAPTEVLAVVEEVHWRDRLADTLVLGLDLFGLAPGGEEQHQLTHPAVSRRGWFDWITDQLFAPSAGAIADAGVRALTGELSVRHDYADGGAMRILRAAAPEPAPLTALPPGAARLDPAQLDAVRRLIGLADVAESTLCLVWHPHSQAVLNTVDPRDLARIKQTIGDIGADLGATVVDLMDAPWARDVSAWIDPKHLAPAAAMRELDAILAACPSRR